MHALIVGGGGMVGHKLAEHIMAHGIGDHETRRLTLCDVAFPRPLRHGGAERIIGDMSDPSVAAKLAANRPDIVFLLASIVSGDAEADFDLGWRVNAIGTRHILEALRNQHLLSAGRYRPRLVFTSSIAVFGSPFPARIGDDFLCAPQTSYGAQKVVAEMMVGDFARKGFIDGLSIRLPTICVRPGAPNKALSSFFSGIIREPLNGQEAVLPVPDTVRHWHASPRSAVGFLLHAASLDTARLKGRHALNLPGVSCTVEEQIEALRKLAGNDAVALIKPRPDPMIAKVIAGWPQDFEPRRAQALGFTAEDNFETIIRTYIEDDLSAHD